ncbi:MAG: aldolase [Gammaproteobacteria bacterium]|nr:aldolase [Gammaproteobacteria bacterium]
MNEDLNSVVCNHTKAILDGGGMALMMSVRASKSVDTVLALQAAGFDSFFVDLEHGGLTMPEASQLAVMGLAAGVSVFVRLPGHSATAAAQALDGGAWGVIVPHLQTPEQARAMADACLYPPLGHRSASSTVPHLRFRDWPVAAARARLNEQAMLICQIETLLGVENASAIAAVDGVSMLLLGGNDLSADMGIPGEYTHPRFIEAVGRIIDAAREHGKHCGIAGIGSAELMQQFYARGARLFSLGTDTGAFLARATQLAATAREMPG